MGLAARKCFVIALCEIAILLLGLWVAVKFPDAPPWILLVLAVVALLAAVVVWNLPAWKRHKAVERAWFEWLSAHWPDRARQFGMHTLRMSLRDIGREGARQIGLRYDRRARRPWWKRLRESEIAMFQWPNVLAGVLIGLTTDTFWGMMFVSTLAWPFVWCVSSIWGSPQLDILASKIGSMTKTYVLVFLATAVSTYVVATVVHIARSVF